MSKKIYMTQAEYSRHRNVSQTAVMKAINVGRIPFELDENGHKRIDVLLADEEWDKNTFLPNSRTADGKSKMDEMSEQSEGDEGPAPGEATRSLVKQKEMIARVDYNMKRVALDEKLGKLVNAELVKNEAYRLGRSMRDAMLNLPNKISAKLCSITDPILMNNELKGEIEKALEGFIESQER